MGKIKVQKNVGGIEGLCVIEPKVFGDSRGYFVETYNKNDMLEEGLDLEFVQDNQSSSSKGVLRGLHFRNSIHRENLCVSPEDACLMWQSIFVRKARLTENGLVWN